MLMNLELVEALCGFQKVIHTLDDRDLIITTIPGSLFHYYYFINHNINPLLLLIN